MTQTKKSITRKALKEHFEIDVKYGTLDAQKTRQMLTKVRGLLKESRGSANFTKNQTSASYLKLVMMEQALYSHYSDLAKQTRIVVENEEVEKSQVILAAQDMIDQVQKMIEQVSKMNAEELPAVVSGVSNEIGTSESESYNQTTAEALTTLLSALTTAKGSLTSSLGQITGEGGGEDAGFGDMGDDMGGEEEEDFSADLETPMGDEEISGEEESDAIPELPEPDEDEDFSMAGRELR